MTTKTAPAIKWAGESRDMIEGLLAPYGGPAKLGGKDLQGEFFTKSTDFALSWFGDWQRPMLYQHGFDDALKTTVVGRIKVTPTDKGLWMQAQLDKANEYYDAIASLVDKDALGLSSGSVSHLVEVEGKSGEIKSWPLIEGSLTPTPAHPEARAGYSVKTEDAVAHLAVIGTFAPAELLDDDEDDDDEAVKAIDLPLTEEEVVALAEAIEYDNATVSVKVVADTTEAFALIEAVKSALTPQALHDAAVASGAACAPSETKSEPARLLAIAGKRAETPPVDLDAFKAQMSELAERTVKELLGS